MPITGIKDTRRRQLIDATLASVAEYGLQNTTINSISRLAGMSSGIISHYFGGKQELIEATVRQLLDELKQALLSRASADISPQQRLMRIVEANFTEFQRSRPATKSWLSFWAQAMHDPRLARLQQVNSQRLISNLRYSFRPLLGPEQAKIAAHQTAALIDGFWLRSALSPAPDQEFRDGEQLCKKFITDLLQQHGVFQCH
ncbi:transcriptional regulator BetI [Oceanimonas baumannii]|uniref:HTH-type transcriptional regulator BetI n=1 Tax=Oceanimonas baumannii TaxID=129578 RepID=A0A235CMF5_9GAMM|nr:transcriptional regulator BetI [Oceanimonas baumannii]MCC4265160.1 transcriptional regulator BetI [Oceanimonas baumannii]OYD25025.1 transcriptional regulator BetI [Oceanimonas baumannii]TDW59801.1 TetR family transcriptional regulator [Oceanimonas baumannii]